MTHLSLRARVMWLGILPALLIALSLGAYFSHQRVADAEQAMQARGQALARQLAVAIQFDMAGRDQSRLRALLQAVQAESDVGFVAVVNAQRQLLVTVGNVPKTPFDPAALNPVAGVWLFAAPLSSAVGNGWVWLGIAQSQLNTQRHGVWLAGATVSLLGLLFSIILALRLSNTILHPVRRMLAVVHEIGSGALHARVTGHGAGELGALQAGINQMAESLSRSRNELQQRVREATADMAAQKEAAERANIAKSHFLAVASHDLRQPMHAMGLFLAALKEQVVAPDALRIVENIEASVAAMSGLFNALLDISRLDAGVIEVQTRVFPANRLLDHIRTAFTAQAEAKGLKLLVVPSRLLLHSDPLLLERIVFNLVSNALRYTERGGVVVGCRWHAGRICIEVWDSGCGIAADKQRAVFQEFVQLHNPERDRDKGLGLGLAIVERLALLLACQVSLRSQPGRGSIFGMQVPRAAAGAVAEEQREVGRATLSGQLRGVVAVVDDDESILAGMCTLLTGWGLTVVTARGSAELMAQLAAPPDVLLCDFRLRDGVSGLDVIATLRQRFNQAIAVVLITGDTATDAVREIKASGHPLLHKPLRPAKLRTLLAKMLPHG